VRYIGQDESRDAHDMERIWPGGEGSVEGDAVEAADPDPGILVRVVAVPSGHAAVQHSAALTRLNIASAKSSAAVETGRTGINRLDSVWRYCELRHSRKRQVVFANQLRQLILIVEHLLIDPLIAEPRHPFLDLLLNDSRRGVGTE